MLRETAPNVRVDLSEGYARISKVEVVLPAFQVPVQFLNRLRDRLKTLFASYDRAGTDHAVSTTGHKSYQINNIDSIDLNAYSIE